MLPEAAGRGQHFQARGHSFSLYGPTLSRTITCLSFFLAVNWLTNDWACLRKFIIELAYNCLQTIRKKSNERTSEYLPHKELLYVNCI